MLNTKRNQESKLEACTLGLALLFGASTAFAELELYQQLAVDPVPPSNVTLEQYDDNANAHLFLERPCFSLDSDLAVDVTSDHPGIYADAPDLIGVDGIIPAGSRVACAMIHSESDVVSGSITYKGIVEFDQTIEGLIVTTNNLNNSDAACQSPRVQTIYPVGISRGMELRPVIQDMFEFSQIPADSVRFQNKTFGKIDEIRIILSCPSPVVIQQNADE